MYSRNSVFLLEGELFYDCFITLDVMSFNGDLFFCLIVVLCFGSVHIYMFSLLHPSSSDSVPTVLNV